jgi:hypothetical protein
MCSKRRMRSAAAGCSAATRAASFAG